MDFTADTNHAELHRLSRLYNFPAFVKNADTDTLSPEPMPSSLYAAPGARNLFPCHNKAATYLSWVWFLDKEAEFKPTVAKEIRANLSKFAHVWGLGAAVQELEGKHSELHKAAEAELPDELFTFVWKDAQGQRQRACPLRNGQEVKAAAEWLQQYRGSLTYLDRQKMAEKILEKAATFHVELGELDGPTQRQAGRGYCQPKQAAQLIRNRINSFERLTPVMREEFSKLATALEKAPDLSITSQTLCHVAATLDAFDKMANIKLSSFNPPAEDVLFALSFDAVKIANEFFTTTGSAYTPEQLARLKLAAVRDVFGAEVSNAVANGLNVDGAKMAEFASTMPRPDAQMLDLIMKEAGLAPVAKSAGAQVRLQASDWLKLAGFYDETRAG